MLADLVHHVRAELTVPQLCRVVHIYACCLHEPSFTFGIQTMCAKLLLNLIETICNKTEKTESPRYLMTILESCIDKLAAVESIHGRLKEVYAEPERNEGRAKGVPEWLLIEKGKPVHAVSYASEGTEAFGRGKCWVSPGLSVTQRSY